MRAAASGGGAIASGSGGGGVLGKCEVIESNRLDDLRLDMLRSALQQKATEIGGCERTGTAACNQR